MVTVFTRIPERARPITGEALTPVQVGTDIALYVTTEPGRIMKLDRSHISFRVEAGLSPSGAAIRLSIPFPATRGRPCHFDAYLDPGQSESRYIFLRLMAQEEVQVCFQDPEGNQVGQALIPLTQADRNELARIVMRGIAHNLTLASVDFAKARHCMMRDVAIQDMPLEQFKSFTRDLYN